MSLHGGFPSDNEQFFIFSDGSPVLPTHVRDTLRKLLKAVNLEPLLYNTHSLRSGRSCDLIKLGYPIEHVKNWVTGDQMQSTDISSN